MEQGYRSPRELFAARKAAKAAEERNVKISCISTQRTVLLKAGQKSYRAKFYGNDAKSATLEYYNKPNACWHFLDGKGRIGQRVIDALLKQLADDPSLLANISPDYLQTDYYRSKP